VFIVSASSGWPKAQFCANFDIWAASVVPTPFYRIGYPRYTLTCQILPRSVYSVANSPSVGENPQFLSFFRLRHLVVSPSGSSLRKSNIGAQLQTFPYPNGIKIVSVLQRLHGEIGPTISNVQKRNEQTNRQTDKKTQHLRPPRRRVKSEPHQSWHIHRGPRARSCTSKTFGV